MSNEISTEVMPASKFSGFLDKFKPQLALALPTHMNADRMARLALTAFSSTPALQKCEPRSILASLMIAGQLGLEPGVNGAGYLIPYTKNKKTAQGWEKHQECQFVPGWKGLIDLVARSGRGTVFTGVIYRDQQYTFVDGAKRDLIIHNETDLDDPSDITHAYAIGWVKNATMPIIELWRVSKIIKHRDKYNKVGEKHYSYRDWEMYSRKVPLLQVLKYMPCSIEVSNAISINNAAEMGHTAIITDGIVIDNDSGEEYQEPNDRSVVVTAVLMEDAIRSAADIEALNALTKEIGKLPPEEKKSARAMAAARAAEIRGVPPVVVVPEPVQPPVSEGDDAPL
jgi:recombination protein RecT